MHTHVPPASLADVSPRVWSATLANLSLCASMTSSLTTRQNMLDEQSSWTCQSCVDGPIPQQLLSQWNTASRRSSSVPSPALPVEDPSTSMMDIYHSSVITSHFNVTTQFITTILINRSFVRQFNYLIIYFHKIMSTTK